MFLAFPGPASSPIAREYISVDKLAPASPSIIPNKAPAGSVKQDSRQSAGAKNRNRSEKSSSSPQVSRGRASSGGNFIGPSGSVLLFGTVEFKKPLESLPDWIDVLARNSHSPIFQDQKHFNRNTSWAQLKEKLRDKPLPEQLRLVNTFWNSWPYIEDIANWQRQDYWAIPAEFLKKSGDCEDYAIVKYFTLKEIGVDPRKMRIVVLRDTIRNLAHAVLVVYSDGDAFVLDNLSRVVLSHSRIANYSPQYSVNEFGRWAHIKGKKAR